MTKIKVKAVKTKEPVIKKAEKVSFSFAELRTYSYDKARKDGSFFIKFLERLSKISSLDWDTVDKSERHSYGTETMPVSMLAEAAKKKAPSGVEKLKVFRSMGDNHVFLGYREDNTFHVVFIEYKFGDIYKHN